MLLFILIVASKGAFAQGTVNFANVATGLPVPSPGVTTNSPTVANAAATGTYSVAFYWDSTAVSAGAGIDPASPLLTLESMFLTDPNVWSIPGQFNGQQGDSTNSAGNRWMFLFQSQPAGHLLLISKPNLDSFKQAIRPGSP